MESQFEDTTEDLFISEVQGTNRKNIQYTLMLNDSPVNFKLDTGAECNVVSKKLVDRLKGDTKSTTTVLKSFGGYALNTIGMCSINTTVPKHQASRPVDYYVVANQVTPLLGLEACLSLGLISIDENVHKVGVNAVQNTNVLDEYEDVFKD